jgi:twitching motility protein PilT
VSEASSPATGVVVELVDWLKELAAGVGSDLHLKVASPPMLRERGELRRLERPPLSAAELAALAEAIVPAQRAPLLHEDGEVDFAHSVPGVGRFRANVFRQRGAISMVMRKLRVGGPSFEEIGIPQVVEQLAEETRGLVLVTGPTGSGKTTTLAAMIGHINATRAVHIVTIEDPIEILHPDKMASVNQREVGQDSKSFLSALRAALRQDPDVILIGEMRDPETVRAALQAAETGHFVLSTLHTTDATETVNRILDFFPAHQQQQIRYSLAGVLRGIVCQRLVPGTTKDRVPCVEVCVNNGRIAERIAKPELTGEIGEVIAKSGHYGMRTFDQSLVELVTLGDITVEDAMASASEPHDLKLKLEDSRLVGSFEGSNLSFERDIKPLFGETERAALAWQFDVWDYDTFRANAWDVITKIERREVPFENGWPEERVAMLRSWLREGLMAP